MMKMWSSVLCICFGLVATTVKISNGHGISREDRVEELRRIEEYELIDIKYNIENGELTFDAFGERFGLSLQLNNDLIASNIRHSGDGIPDTALGHITSLTSSCHHLVKSISLLGNNGKEFSGSGGGISMCNKRGYRGLFWHSGEAYTIVPARYYLSNMDNGVPKHFTLDEKHMIWKESRFNTTGWTRRPSKGVKLNSKKDEEEEEEEKEKEKMTNKDHKRKLQATNGGKNYIEMGVISDPSFYSHFINSYSSEYWYDELVGWTMDFVNQMTSEYGNTNWGSNIGEITIIIREFSVFSSHSGIYAVLQPNSVGTNRYDGSDYLSNLYNFVWNNKDMNDIDNYQLFTRYDLWAQDNEGNWIDIGGIAYMRTVCRSKYASVSVNQYSGNNNWFFKTIRYGLCMHIGLADKFSPCLMKNEKIGSTTLTMHVFNV